MGVALFDRLSVNNDELSFLIPKTRDGAIFTLVVAYASFDGLGSIQDTELRERRRRRGIRLLYSLLYYIAGDGVGDRNDDQNNQLIRFYIPPWDDARRSLEWGKGCSGTDEDVE